MVDIIIECALCIQPMTRYLYKNGIISIHGHDNCVHCTNEFFFSAFKDFKIKDTGGSDYYEAVAEKDGTTFFTLVDKEVSDAEE